jgi:hypothetical protein
MPPKPQIVQLARILGLDAAGLDDLAAARDAIDANTDTIADAFFHEAADSDDVLSPETAQEYLEVRLAFFGELVSDGSAERIRERFGELVSRWE